MTEEVTETQETEIKAADSKTVALPAFFGVKAGMTRIFDDSGNHIPVTVIKLVSNKISQVKTKENDGYEAYQVAFNEKREKLVNQPTKKKLEKAGVSEAFSRFAEIRMDGVDEANLGKEVSLEDFQPAALVDICGVTKGKGFQGVVKRHNFAVGPMSHGSHFHRTGGSVGACNKPGRIWKNRKMPGQMGNKKTTVQNLKVVAVNPKEGFLLVKGSVPGSKNSFLRVQKALKA